MHILKSPCIGCVFGVWVGLDGLEDYQRAFPFVSFPFFLAMKSKYPLLFILCSRYKPTAACHCQHYSVKKLAALNGSTADCGDGAWATTSQGPEIPDCATARLFTAIQ